MMAENPIDRLLSEKDIPTLVNILTPVASKCSALGLQLGLKDWQIKNIEKDIHDCKSQLQEILVVRLNKEEPLSWRDLVTALSSDSLREHRVAHQIESHLTSLSTKRDQMSLSHTVTLVCLHHHLNFPHSKTNLSVILPLPFLIPLTIQPITTYLRKFPLTNQPIVSHHHK